MKTISMKLLAFPTAMLCLAASAHAQDTHALVDMMVKHWQTSKDFTMKVAAAMPDDGYSFKATPAEMSFGEQMNHLARGNTSYCSGALGTKNPLGKATDSSKASATKDLATAYDYCIDGLKKLTDAGLMQMVGKAPRQSSRFELFWGGFTHAAHHRGQVEVYLRLKGITPPDYDF